MKRIPVPYMRRDWQKKLDDLGFHFYTMDGEAYWEESIYYQFTSEEIDHLEEVTDELNEMCLALVDYVVKNNLYEKFGIPLRFAEYVRRSWEAREPTVYGRFDFWYDGKGEPKLLEFNADTPTALFEASVVQYYWLQDYRPDEDQFNSIHEKLLAVMEDEIRRFVRSNTLYFSCVKDHLEDLTTTEYLRDLAMQAGIITKHVFVDDIGYDYDYRRFVDLEEVYMEYMFKLYPWEWIISEQFSDQLLNTDIRLLEPAWKMVLSNKAILPLLWEMYPGHKNLLPTFYKPVNTGTLYVEKPFFSREGDGIRVDSRFEASQSLVVYQEYKELPQFSGNYPVIGSWVIGSQSAGIGIREGTTPITNNMSRFVPHLFTP